MAETAVAYDGLDGGLLYLYRDPRAKGDLLKSFGFGMGLSIGG